jgi:hypothetical protein
MDWQAYFDLLAETPQVRAGGPIRIVQLPANGEYRSKRRARTREARATLRRMQLDELAVRMDASDRELEAQDAARRRNRKR